MKSRCGRRSLWRADATVTLALPPLQIFVRSHPEELFSSVLGCVRFTRLHALFSGLPEPPQKPKHTCCCYLFICPVGHKHAWVFLRSCVLLSSPALFVSASRRRNTLTSNLTRAADGTTHAGSCSKRSECYKHLFQLKRRVLCVYACVGV